MNKGPALPRLLERLRAFAGGKVLAADPRFTFHKTGFHGDRYLLEVMDNIARRCDLFIETGANVGSTLAFMARTYPHMRCMSCEPDRQAFEHALRNIAGLDNAEVYNETSEEFMLRLKDGHGDIFRSCALFWLDAHGYGFKWPLQEEVSFVTSEFSAGYMFIDDFLVPGLDCFKYDTYKGQVCSFDFIQDSLAPGVGYRLSYPNYTTVTSEHHPLCGWGLFEFGAAERIELPPYVRVAVEEGC